MIKELPAKAIIRLIKIKRTIDTSDQQKESSKTGPISTIAHSQHPTEGRIGASPQRLAADKLSKHRADRQQHDLLGVGSQNFGLSGVPYRSDMVRGEGGYTCPIHGPSVQESFAKPRHSHTDPMDRYLAESPSARYAILPRSDHGQKTTYGDCTCPDITKSISNNHGHA